MFSTFPSCSQMPVAFYYSVIHGLGFFISLRDEQPVNNNRIPFVVTFHPALPNIGEILQRLHPVLKSSGGCKSAIEQVPVVAFSREAKKRLGHFSSLGNGNARE